MTSIFGSFVLFSIGLLTPSKRGSVLVDIPNGALEGYTLTSRSGRNILAFSGIPYGQPPIGALRFKDPRPALPWRGVKSAKTNIKCVEHQYLFPDPYMRFVDGQEDCLALSVYTHDTNPETLKPVLFYIHGGAYEFRIPPGSWFNPTFFLDYDIVVVIISYRMSALGFLSFEDETVPGNMGLKDQRLALKWTYDNINYFGGDPTKITLCGESAGGASSHLHAIMPSTRHMVHRVILQSGTAYSSWNFFPPGEARKTALRFAEFAGCNRSTTSRILNCLNKIDGRELVKYNDRFRNWWDRDPLVIFRPVAEKPGPNAFITGLPIDWPPVTVPVLMGVDTEDGLLKSGYMLLDDYDYDKLNNNLEQFLPPALFFNNRYTSNITGVVQKFLNHYFGSKRKFSVDDEKQFTKFYSDVIFRYPLALSIERMTNDVYLYVNGFVSDILYVIKNRVFHVQEMFMLWELEALPNSLCGPDLRFSKSLVRYWANFVIYGNPNGLTEERWTKSPKSIDRWKFNVFSLDGERMMTGLYADDLRFIRNSGILDRLI